MKNLKIFVLQHSPCQLPACYSDRSIYTPIQCGRAINAPIPDTLRDDSGDNISALNARYNEMTAIYWVAKHYDEIGNPEFVGFSHYRRFLNWKPKWIKPGNAVVRKWFSWRPLRGQYGCCHDRTDLEKFMARFSKAMPDEYLDIEKYWKTHFFYICNMFIMHRNDFKRYAAFVVHCINLLRNLETEGTLPIRPPGYQSRTPGFILETMTSYWLWHEARQKRLHLIPSTITHFSIENQINGRQPLNHKQFLWFLRQAY